MFRANADKTFPNVSALLKQPAEFPTDREALLAQAHRLMDGHWTVFGRPLELGDAPPVWREHPISHVATPLTHFSRMYYTGSALGGDVKYIWELSRHAELLRLAQAYFLERDERVAERVVAMLRDWMTDNPPSQGVNWLSALEVSFRAIAWCWIWKLTSASAAWGDQTLAQFLWTLAHSATYIEQYDSIHHSPNTHLTGEALGLLYIATCFPELRGSVRWKRMAVSMLVSEIPHQFLDDGFHYERSTGYHRYNVEFYLHAFAIAQNLGEHWAEPFRKPLSKALDASVALRLPNGDWPVFGDEDGGAAVRLWADSSRSQSPLLGLGAALLDRSDLVDDDAVERSSLAWWFGVTPLHRIQGAPTLSTNLPHAGYFIGRDSMAGSDWMVVVDAGPHGGMSTGHAHTDLGHVELCVGNEPVLADPGCAVYASDAPRRDWYRSLAAHAALSVDNSPLATPRGVFGWTTVAPTPVVECVDGAQHWVCRLRYELSRANGIVHERQVILVRGHGLFVIDWVLGKGSHSLSWNWPLGQSAVKVDAAGAVPWVRIGSSVVMTTASTVPLRQNIHDVMRSPTYGVEVGVKAVQLTVDEAILPLVAVTAFRRPETDAPETTLDGQTVHIRLSKLILLCATAGSPARVESLPGDSNVATTRQSPKGVD